MEQPDRKSNKKKNKKNNNNNNDNNDNGVDNSCKDHGSTFKGSFSGSINNNFSTNSDAKKLTVQDLLCMKQKNEKICALTSYDYSFASICDKVGVDILLVGDSAGMVMLGHPSTIPVNIEEMIIFCNAVSKATKRALIVGDLPFGSYQTGLHDAIKNSVSLIKSGCDAVKLEGGLEIVDTIKAIVSTGIPVMGHIGLKPQTSKLWEGYRLQGRTVDSALRLITEATALEEAGVFGIVLELVAKEVSKIISNSLSVPTIGIGSGSSCDGQVLVLHDMLGIYRDIKPRFVKRYAELSDIVSEAVSSYRNEVKSGIFPADINTFYMDKADLNRFHNLSLDKRKQKRSTKEYSYGNKKMG